MKHHEAHKVLLELSGSTFFNARVAEALKLATTLLCEATTVKEGQAAGDNARVLCQNCHRIFRLKNGRPLMDIAERVFAGEPMPACECPACGAVAHFTKQPETRKPRS